MKLMTGAVQKYFTEWTSVFLVASELKRRNYIVSLTMGGRTPIADLMVGCRDGRQFWVDVKGLARKNSWHLKKKREFENLYYILACLAPPAPGSVSRSADRFFIMWQSEANGCVDNYGLTRKNQKAQGFDFKSAEPFEDKWSTLPHSGYQPVVSRLLKKLPTRGVVSGSMAGGVV